MPCHDCPHRKHSEGGYCPDGQALVGLGRFRFEPHPCHNAPTTDCSGHLRDMKGITDGTLYANGDGVKNLYTLKAANGEKLEGEFNKYEIAKFRAIVAADNREAQAALLRGLVRDGLVSIPDYARLTGEPYRSEDTHAMPECQVQEPAGRGNRVLHGPTRHVVG